MLCADCVLCVLCLPIKRGSARPARVLHQTQSRNSRVADGDMVGMIVYTLSVGGWPAQVELLQCTRVEA